MFDLNGNVLKFEGGAAGVEAKDADGFVCSGACAHDGKIYGEGADNEFYFMCTEGALEAIQVLGYREVYTAKDITENSGKYETTAWPETPENPEE